MWSSKTVQLFWKTSWQYMQKALQIFTFFGQRTPFQRDYPMERVTDANGIHKGGRCSTVYNQSESGNNLNTQQMDGDYINVATLYTGA